MKKFFRGFLVALLILLLLVLLYTLFTFPPIMRGMAAKTMCSCVFVSGRAPETVLKKELQVFPGLAEVPLEIDFADSSVTARMLFRTSKAIYRKGLGCTLLAEASEAEVRAQKFSVYDGGYPNQDTIPWPSGDLDAFTVASGADRLALARAINRAFDDPAPEKPVNTHAIVVVYKGKIIGEKYADGFGIHSVLTGWSMTKSITNALVGILVRDAKLSLYAPAPVVAWQNDERKHITLNHLLQASSGLEWSESYFIPGADFHNMFILSDDKAAYAASRKAQYPPGEVLEYSSGTTNILSRIIRETVGEERYHRFPHDALFSRIGMHHAILEPDASGTFVASSYGHATARDWARLGLLFLNDGVWNGERILPEGWVKYSTTPAPAALRREYGAQVWLNLGQEDNPENVKHPGLPNEAILFEGFEDNFVVIIPSRELIVVRLGVTHHDGFSIADLVNGVMGALPKDGTLVGLDSVSSH